MAAVPPRPHSASVRTMDADSWRTPLGIPPDVDAFALASPLCRRCGGRGAVRKYRDWRTCACVHRAVFRACLDTYRHCQANMTGSGGWAFERVGHAQGKCAIAASFKRAEFSADFVMTARRALASRPIELAVFEFHFLAGEEWKVAVPHVNSHLRLARPLYRGSFFHAVYRAQEMVARNILTTAPYRLYPTTTYFAGVFLSAADLALPQLRAH